MTDPNTETINEDGQKLSEYGVLKDDKLPAMPVEGNTHEEPSADGKAIVSVKETEEAAKLRESQEEKILSIQTAYYLVAGKIDTLEKESEAHRDVLDQIATDQSNLSEKIDQQMSTKADLQCVQLGIENEVSRLKEAVKELKHRLLGEPKESPLDCFSPSPFKIPKMSEKRGPTGEIEENSSSITRKSLKDCPLCRDSGHRLADCPQFASKLEKLQQFRKRQICCTCGNLQCSRINCPKATIQCQICKGKQEFGKTLHISEICIFETHVSKRPSQTEYRRQKFSAQRPRSKSPAKENQAATQGPQPAQLQQQMVQQQYQQQPMMPTGPAFGPGYQMNSMIPPQQYQYQHPQQMVPMPMQPIPLQQYGYYQQQPGPSNQTTHHQ
ncbi:hypothetical protein CRE_15109 [Caenorhabditis remanei]|uniref:CCHC-type domain-containing protein n=1 Tax=Caenorhabditis remanei TaxID=31234 RepID=E3NN75_CAERE|nr:hypothetical protein CRE_15109 [Caenorhabditis remanei]